MYILIDNSKDDGLSIFYTLNTKWVQAVFSTKRGIDLLSAIDSCLSKARKKISDLSGLAVVVGRGRFTATRVAATVANTLSYALRIPAAAVNELDTARAVAAIKKVPAGQYISAQYSGEANIGKKKK